MTLKKTVHLYVIYLLLVIFQTIFKVIEGNLLRPRTFYHSKKHLGNSKNVLKYEN